MELLARTDTVVFDKTGTLTEGSFTVTEVYPAVGIERGELLRLCYAAEGNSNHPIARSIKTVCINEGVPFVPCDRVTELAGLGVRAESDGKTLLVGNLSLMRQYGVVCEPCHAVGTAVYVAWDGGYVGAVVISDTVKNDARETLCALRDLGVRRIVMLTGDRERSAEAVATELGVDAFFAELLPADKVRHTEALLAEKKGSLVFVGDGVNDAPVLARADVGIAMGALGSDAAIEAADVVLMDDQPKKIATAIRLARFTRRIVYQNIVFALAVKGIFLLLGAIGMTNMWAATFADVGVAVIAILNAMRTLRYQEL